MIRGGAQMQVSCVVYFLVCILLNQLCFPVLFQAFDNHTPLIPALIPTHHTTINNTFPPVFTPREHSIHYWWACTSRVSHAGGPEEAYGVHGILQAYTEALHNVQLAGPTLFTEVLQTAMARANRPASQTDQRYDVLLILTDGIINDMQQVCACACACDLLLASTALPG